MTKLVINMEYLIGALMTVVFFILCVGSFYLGYRMKQHPQTKPPDVDQEKKQQLERYDNHFKALMNYDVPTALKRKQVTE